MKSARFALYLAAGVLAIAGLVHVLQGVDAFRVTVLAVLTYIAATVTE